MRSVAIAALLAIAMIGCRRKHDAPPPAPAAKPSPSALVPALPLSPDGAVELAALDRRIEIHEAETLDVSTELVPLGQRIAARGRLEDYQAQLAITAAWVARAPTDPEAWLARAHALATVHDFAGARAAIAHAPGPAADEQTVALDEATGPRDRALAARATAAHDQPNPITLTQYAAALALAGRFDDARALIPQAAARVHDNPAELFSWLYFQWGRVHEQAGDLAAARAFYEASRARMHSVEVTAHLIAAELGTGDRAAAAALVKDAIASDPHPSLLELAVPMQLATVADARAAWERYVAALPLAFADHAARFYLGAGADPARALVLARQNLANRDVPEARALVVEAALAAGDAAAACAVVDPLLAAPQRGDRFTAWKALARCGRNADADRLAAELGIAK